MYGERARPSWIPGLVLRAGLRAGRIEMDIEQTGRTAEEVVEAMYLDHHADAKSFAVERGDLT